jgi:hypothetical protein
LGAKTVFLGGSTLNEIAKGTITGPDKLIGIIQDNIAKGKFSAEKLATIDKDAVEAVLQAARTTNTTHMDPNQAPLFAAGLVKLKANATDALTNRNTAGKITGNVAPLLRDIENL